MRSLTNSQWSRVWDLVERIQSVPEARRHAEFGALFNQRVDPAILSLVALQLRLPHEEDADLTGKRVGKYTLEERIGAGGMGVAYLGRHDATGHPAVVKLIHPALAATDRDATRRFLDEVKTLARLQHIGIARTYDGGIHDRGKNALPYLAMEYVRGFPITVYRREQSPGLSELLEKFLRACEAVQYANNLRVVHCDLKPDHILIDEHGFPRVLDFGLARLFDPSLPRVARGLFAGTPAYMAPEQASDECGEVGPWTDVYALGVILFELLTGRRPYEVPAGPPEAIGKAILRAEPVKLGSINSKYHGELENIVYRAIRKDPTKRYRTVADFQAALRRYLASAPDAEGDEQPSLLLDPEEKLDAELFELASGTMGISVADEKKLDPNRAIASAEAMVKKDSSSNGHNLAGVILSMAGLNRRALEYYKKAAALDENNEIAWINLAQAHQVFHQFEESNQAFIKAMTARSDYSWLKHIEKMENTPEVQNEVRNRLQLYARRLGERTKIVEEAVQNLKESDGGPKRQTIESNPLDFRVESYEVKRGRNASQFVIQIGVKDAAANAMILCYGDDEDAATIVLPFQVPDPDEFGRQEVRFLDYFGCERLKMDDPDESNSNGPMRYFAGKLPYQKVDSPYLMKWFIHSIMFQSNGEAFLRGEPFWEVATD